MSHQQQLFRTCTPPKDKNRNCSQANYEDLICNFPKYQDLKCAHPEHQKPIQIVVLDANLKQNERLLCKSCIKEFESNQKTIGLEKAVALTYENYQKKRELREIVFNENIKQLEQLNNNFISLKTFVNQKIDEMILTTQNWMKDLNQVKSQQYQFHDEIDLLIKQQKIEIDLIAEEIKTLNNKWISKLNKNLEWFSKFKEYSDCVNILKNLSEDQVQKQQQKIKMSYQGQQQQIYYNLDKQEQAQIRYYIYQDLQNLINLIYSSKAVLEHFNNDLSNPMVVLSTNKILLQLNLSSGIHYDLQQKYSKNLSLSNFLNQERKKAFQILEQIIDNNDINKQFRGQNPFNQQLLKYKSNYVNLSFGLNEFELIKTNFDPNFDENVLSKVISSMQTLDIQVNLIKDHYFVPSLDEMITKAQNYESITKQKLNQNFPKSYYGYQKK